MVKIGPSNPIRLPDGRIMILRKADEAGLITWSRVECWTSSPRAERTRTVYFANWHGTPNLSWEVSRQTYLKMSRRRR